MGSHYGKKIRDRERKATDQSRAKHACPKCGKKAVKREGSGIWLCRSCGVKFAGGAYSPETTIGATARRSIKSGSQPTPQE